MADKIEPHGFFEVVRPDEVAETWDGVTAVEGLYQALWDQVNSYKAPKPEVAEEPTYGLDSVSDFWENFSDTHKTELNRLADEYDLWISEISQSGKED